VVEAVEVDSVDLEVLVDLEALEDQEVLEEEELSNWVNWMR